MCKSKKSKGSLDSENSNNSIGKCFKTIIVIIVFLIGLGIVAPGLFAIHYLIQSSASIDDLIKCDVINIVSFVVTIWAGLNIANYFDKKELESFEENIKFKLSEKEKAYEGLSIELSQKSVELTILKENLEATLLENFLSALLQSREDLMTSYFYEQFRCENTLCSALLIAIENYFAQAFMLYGEKCKENEVLSNVHRGINKINELKSEMQNGVTSIAVNKLTQAYLEFRKAEFMFYGSKSINDREQRKKWLLEAETLYFSSSELLGFFLVKFEKNMPSTEFTGSRLLTKKYSAYYANTLGEIYREIYKDTPNDSIYDTAKFYYECATSWTKDEEYKRGIYYRNYGILLEKPDDLDSYTAAKEKYMEAMKTGDTSWSLWHSIISISNKIINTKMKIPFAEPCKDRDVLLSSDAFMSKLRDLSPADRNEIMEELGQLYDNVKVVTSLFSCSHDGYLYFAIYYRDLYLFDCLDGSNKLDNIQYAYSEIKKAKKINGNDNLVKVIERDIVDLRKNRAGLPTP